MSQGLEGSQANCDMLRDCLLEQIVRKTKIDASGAVTKKSKNQRKENRITPSVPQVAGNDDEAEGLTEFVDYLAAELFAGFPQDCQLLSYATIKSNVQLSDKYLDPLPSHTITDLLATISPSVTDSLEAYSLSEPGSERNFFLPIFQHYVNTATTPPPVYNPADRASACEICDRDWLPLSYHHLIPRSVHAKVVKRGWHEEWQLQSVAWLCRACHSFVHRIAGNEELAREWYSIERLMEREDVQQWAKWVGRVRWKAK